jgi:hypothetical protein
MRFWINGTSHGLLPPCSVLISKNLKWHQFLGTVITFGYSSIGKRSMASYITIDIYRIDQKMSWYESVSLLWAYVDTYLFST